MIDKQINTKFGMVLGLLRLYFYHIVMKTFFKSFFQFFKREWFLIIILMVVFLIIVLFEAMGISFIN